MLFADNQLQKIKVQHQKAEDKMMALFLFRAESSALYFPLIHEVEASQSSNVLLFLMCHDLFTACLNDHCCFLLFHLFMF